MLCQGLGPFYVVWHVFSWRLCDIFIFIIQKFSSNKVRIFNYMPIVLLVLGPRVSVFVSFTTCAPRIGAIGQNCELSYVSCLRFHNQSDKAGLDLLPHYPTSEVPSHIINNLHVKFETDWTNCSMCHVHKISKSKNWHRYLSHEPKSMGFFP